MLQLSLLFSAYLLAPSDQCRSERGSLFFTHQHGPNELARAVLEALGYALWQMASIGVLECGLKRNVTLDA